MYGGVGGAEPRGSPLSRFRSQGDSESVTCRGCDLHERDNPARRRKRPETGLEPAVQDSEGHLNPEIREGWTRWGSTRLPEVFERDNRAHRMRSGSVSLQ